MIHLQGLQPLDPSTRWAQITGISNVTTTVLATAYALKVSHALGDQSSRATTLLSSGRQSPILLFLGNKGKASVWVILEFEICYRQADRFQKFAAV